MGNRFQSESCKLKKSIHTFILKFMTMKNYNVKGWTRLLVLAMVAMVVMVSCKDDEEPNPPVLVEDGLYIQGGGTALTELGVNGLLSKAKNEVLQEERSTLYEMYIAVKGGSEGFNIVNVVGGVATSWGPGSDFAQVAEADLNIDEPKNGLWRGSYTETETPFTVPEDGLYYVALDTELGVIAVAKVEWGLIGGATPGGWSNDTPMTEGTFDLNSITFTVEDVTMLESDWKFRFSGGWKIILDADYDLGEGKTGIKVNTNFGGSLTALDAGGANITNTEYAIYEFSITWSLANGYTATQTKTGEAEPLPEYPESLYMIGASIGGWDWATNGIEMIPVNSHPNAFWRIVWIESGVADAGIKFAPQMEWVGDFGVADDTQPGVGDHLKGGSNVPDVAESGYYMVWVDLERDSISVAVPEVYLIGAVVDNVWDTPNPDALFTVDNANEKLTITKDLTAGELRMYAWHKWHYDWWQHEFIILNDMIEYRGTGNDQERVNLAAGTTTIDLNFKTGAGSITQ
jgi:hypothetical protein